MFDIRQKGCKRTAMAKISNPFDQPKGVQPVRQFYKVDESKMLWSSRLGIDIEATGIKVCYNLQGIYKIFQKKKKNK